jgi:hypothetical protein
MRSNKHRYSDFLYVATSEDKEGDQSIIWWCPDALYSYPHASLSGRAVENKVLKLARELDVPIQ